MIKSLLSGLWHGLRAVLRALAALLILFEEWGWEPLHRGLARLGRLPVLRHIEAFIGGLGPQASLAVFVLPTVLLLPVKLGALWLLSRGHAWAGVGVIVLAKVVGTAVLARLFTLTQPALMQLEWFARLYTRWSTWKAGVLAQVRASRTWRAARWLRRRVVRQARQWWWG